MINPRCMLSPQDRLYFIHIPKTAGTTLIPLLDARFHVNEICPAQLWEELVVLPQETLPHYRFFRGHFGGKGLDSFLPRPPVRITMIRHPVPLSLSTYKFILREPGTRLYQIVKSNALNFDDFILNNQTRPAITNKQVRDLSRSINYVPGKGPILQTASETHSWLNEHKLLPPNEERVEVAWDLLKECAFFGLVERFDESMALLSWTFGWPPPRQVQDLLVAPGGAKVEELSDVTLKKLLQLNRHDLSLYEEGEKVFNTRMTEMMRDLARYAEPEDRVPKTFSDNPAMVHTLLDRHYQALRSLHVRCTGDRVRLDLDEPLYGAGWHRREKTPGDFSTFRWSGPSQESFIDLCIRGNEDLELTFRVVNALAPDILDSLKVTANKQPVDLEIIDGHHSVVRVYRGVIPSDVKNHSSGFVRLGFAVNRTVSQKSLGMDGSDERQVGIALNWVQVRPLNVSAEGEASINPTRKDTFRGSAFRDIYRRIVAGIKQIKRKQ